MSKITEKKEVVHKRVEEVLIGRKCDVCGKPIKQVNIFGYNYFVVHTWHDDWGYDSADSHEYYDACCAECALSYVKPYVEDAYRNPHNSRKIQIEHVRRLESGATDPY